VRLLLDTHTLLWAAGGHLERDAQTAIEEEADAVFVSAATVWEIEIKRALNRLHAPDDVAGLVEQSGFQSLAIGFEHAREAGRLPPLHGDPFDRMLVAQARVEGLTLASADDAIRRYEVAVLDVARVS
jgi:PIN domain nuclease of toxin-antitoxin system